MSSAVQSSGQPEGRNPGIRLRPWAWTAKECSKLHRVGSIPTTGAMRFVIMSILAVLLFVMFAGSASAAPEELLHRHRHVAEVAEAQVGDAYVYGAAGPDVFDCSGLSMYAWSMYRNLSHNAAAQFASLPPIAESFVMRGDLVYFNFDGGDVDHVEVLV